MKRDADFFGERELDLLYIAKKLKEALRLEELLTAANIDYAVEVDRYMGGVIFKTERAGAFFYVLPEALREASEAMTAAGMKPATGLSDS